MLLEMQKDLDNYLYFKTLDFELSFNKIGLNTMKIKIFKHSNHQEKGSL